MPVRLIAARRYYDKALGREYAPGQGFEVDTQAEADRLVRVKKAKLEPPRPAQRAPRPAPPAPEPAAPQANTPPPAAPRAVRAAGVATGSPDAEASGTYQRRDLRAEDPRK